MKQEENNRVKLVVGISDAKVSASPEDEILTYSLGSCIGVTVYDRKVKVGGMLHFQLPNSKDNIERAQENPFMFADTGMKEMVRLMRNLGAEMKNIQIMIAGGAQIMNDARLFQIGKRNYAAIRQLLWKKGLFIHNEDVGGNHARSLKLIMSDGQVIVGNRDEKKIL